MSLVSRGNATKRASVKQLLDINPFIVLTISLFLLFFFSTTE